MTEAIQQRAIRVGAAVTVLLVVIAYLNTAGSTRRVPVSSSAMESVGYDASSQTLEIEFPGGEVYRYFNVPPEVHRGLLDAPSHGRYFHQHIRGTYAFERME